MWKLSLLAAILVNAVNAAWIPIYVKSGQYNLESENVVIIKSMQRRGQYYNRQNVWFNLTCDDYAASVLFTCGMFDLHKTKKCNDFMALYDGNALVGDRHCNRDAPSDIVSGDNFLDINFKTNKKGQSSGFCCFAKCKHTNLKTTAAATTSNTVSTTPMESTTTVSTTTQTTPTTPSTPAAYSECECGIANVDTRIVGGTETGVNQYPWQCGLVSPRLTQPFCGCSIIKNKYVITAAHCVDRMGTDQLEVVAGDHQWNVAGETPSISKSKVQSIIMHHSYNSVTYDNDIAILELVTPFDLNKREIDPVCLPAAGADFTGETATVSGWGTTSSGGTQSVSLLEVDIEIFSDSKCQSQLGNALTPNMICAGYDAGGRDSCQGDSGGPLVVEQNGKYTLAGVVSWGIGCGQAVTPGVYAEVSNYIDWINDNTNDGKTCGARSAVVTTAGATTTATTTPTSTSYPGFQCSCGNVEPFSDLATSIEGNPWTSAIKKMSENKVVCSAVLINTYNVLTAKSCINTEFPTDYEVLANTVDPFTRSDAIRRPVASVVFIDDILIAKISTALSPIARPGVKNLCLPRRPISIDAETSISGYSSRYNWIGRFDISLTPDAVPQRLISLNTLGCDAEFLGAPIFRPTYEMGTSDTLVGLSLQANCDSTTPVANISYYKQWIMDNTADGRFCEVFEAMI